MSKDIKYLNYKIISVSEVFSDCCNNDNQSDILLSFCDK